MNIQNQNMAGTFNRETMMTMRRYDRLAAVYDLRSYLAEEYGFGKFRASLWSHLTSGRILELGVGTGANIPYYPKDSQITAVDFSTVFRLIHAHPGY